MKATLILPDILGPLNHVLELHHYLSIPFTNIFFLSLCLLDANNLPFKTLTYTSNT
ncbi:hypothetical protein MtrunA17_Chr6g0457711 [Medicago truncatula]|uniref:Transmembrane protein n=1 Tax=Medicago truncatula TaxID=3880 RepID=I3T496_MEDTR|nr:unknown [Medicago truncatula]RHN50469.1 hypothetical protein MtrunA17_Chr6g0457711 [Medicago truncatula]